MHLPQVTKIDNEMAMKECDTLMVFRGGCALRLKNLILSTPDELNITCFKVIILFIINHNTQ